MRNAGIDIVGAHPFYYGTMVKVYLLGTVVPLKYLIQTALSIVILKNYISIGLQL